MGLADIVWGAVFLGGAFYLLYRSFWKKKGHCSSCEGCGCEKK